jgi:predicted RND superfamily exporter protein
MVSAAMPTPGPDTPAAETLARSSEHVSLANRGWSDPTAARLFRLSIITLVVFAAAAPWVARAAIKMLGLESTTPIEWVPASFPAREAYATFTREFESGDVVIASWPGCTLEAETVPALIEAATGPAAPRNDLGQRWFESVVTGRQAVDRLMAEPLALTRAEAVDRLQGVLVGPDRRQTCVIVGLTPEGLADRRRAVAWIRARLMDITKQAASDLHLAGPVIDNVAVDAASDESLRIYGGPAALIVFGLTWFALRSFRYAVVVFLLALGCVGLCFASLEAWGDRMNPVLIVMPLLVLTLGVSGGIHLVNYLVEEYRRGPARGAAWRAMKVGWVPCSLSAGTTALGLASLIVSELEPIRVFGFHAAVGVLGTLVVIFLVLPGIFARWPIRTRVDSEHEPAGAIPWAGFVTRRAGWITAGAMLALAIAAAGVPGIRTSVGIDTLFTPESRVIRDYAWLEKEIGPLVPVEVALRFTAEDAVRPAERLDLARAVAVALGELPEVTSVMSAALFVPDLPEVGGLRAAARKAVVARKLESSLTQLSDMRLIRDVDGGQLWRVTARTSALAGLDYGSFLEQVRGVVEPVVERHGGVRRGISADYTGAMPLINAIQKTLLRDLFVSFLSACGVISLVTMVVERGVFAGLVAMVPNVFPMILLFGLLGWARAALDIGSVMTASVALGMAVDGTFHFLTFFRRGLAAVTGAGIRPSGRRAAVHSAFRHSAAALLQSGLVCGVGILAFAASPFAPTRRFAWMLSLLVGIALVGDLVVLPALLSTPLGRWFRPRRHTD